MSPKKTLSATWTLLGFTLIALTGIRTISNPEIFTHIALGQTKAGPADPISYTLANQNWIDLHPLYNRAVAALWSLGGAPLITLIHVALLVGAAALLFRLSKQWGGPTSRGVALLLCAWLLLPTFAPGPAAVGLFFSALFVTLLSRLKHFPILASTLLPLQILWTNMHPSFLFGPALIAFFAIENLQATRAASRANLVTPLTYRLLGLAAAAALVTLANPNSVNLHAHILSNGMLLTGSGGHEWISLFQGGFSQRPIIALYLFCLVLCAGGLVTFQKKLPAALTFLALTGTFLTVRSIAALPSFAVLALPFLILSAESVGNYLARTRFIAPHKKWLNPALATTALLLTALTAGALLTNRAYSDIGSASSFGLGVEQEAFPVAAQTLLQRADFPQRILNIAHDGGYLALQNPARKVFCDTRATHYGPAFYKKLYSALRGKTDEWNALMADWNPHAVVLNGAWPDAGALANRLVASKAWKLVYFDGATVVLVRDRPEYQALINDPAIQQRGLQTLEQTRQRHLARHRALMQTGNSSRLIGAGGIYLALNRPAEAEAIYRTLTDHSPRMAAAWLGLGQSLLLQKRISEGIGYMERAAGITPRNARVWMGLYQAYRLKADEANTAKAAAQLNKFFQAEAATIEQQNATQRKRAPAAEPGRRP